MAWAETRRGFGLETGAQMGNGTVLRRPSGGAVLGMVLVGLLVVGPLFVVSGGCSDDGGKSSGDAALYWDAAVGDGSSGDADHITDGGPGPDGSEGPCTLGQTSCLDMETEQVCEDVEGVPTWVPHACEAHGYCLADQCEAACLDECALGATRMSGGVTQTCRLYSADSQSFVEPGAGLRDRARLYDAWMQAHNLANGYVCETLFSDTSYQTPTAYLGTVDSAEWTGVYLAAESFRLMTTGSPEAEARVEALVERIHQLFDITGQPGSMARVWAPLGQDPLFDAMYDSSDFSHHQTTYQGQNAFWHGWTSRDMYAGAVMGLSVAYDALASEAHRDLIREVVMGLAMELIQHRTNVPVTVRFNAFGSWQEQTLNFDMENVVLIPQEMQDGKVFVQVGTEEDPSDYGSSELKGAREFFPNFKDFLGQVPLIGGMIPSVPRPGSAMMLAMFLRTALHVSEGVASLAADRAQIEAYYDAHIDDWISVMAQYAYHNANDCWKQYFGITIAYHPILGLLRLETDPNRRAALQNQVLGAKMWPPVQTHKNPYFAYIAASQGAAGLVDSATLQDIGQQVAGFVPPPKMRRLVDNRGSYPADSSCPNLSTEPIDVATRVPTDFLWQHHPFELVTPEPLDRLVFPAVDYLIAYWMGRHYGYLDDDAPNTCTRWDP